MKITKYEHACLVVEEEGKRLIIDPGAYTKSLTDFANVVCIVITHVHADHFNKDLVMKILKANPGAIVISVKEVTDQLTEARSITTNAGGKEGIGPFSLEFFGGHHAFIHDGNPVNQNVGVLVNDILYYPGDSYDLPSKTGVKIAAVPASGPWMKAGEAMDFLLALKPKQAFPTHDAFLSEIGEGFVNNWLSQAEGTGYKALKPGESLEVV
jgi:L-ascorbate metabolism protein UlaG (beta-lactamase superfamily)